MKPSTISPTIFVKNVKAAKEFYTTRFDAKITFDCGWYVNFEFGKGGPTLQFMEPQSPDHKEFQGGLTYNIQLNSTDMVDAAHDRLTDAGLTIIMPLEDHPWGDRGFSTLDPYGVGLYIYADTEPTEEFKQFFID